MILELMGSQQLNDASLDLGRSWCNSFMKDGQETSSGHGPGPPRLCFSGPTPWNMAPHASKLAEGNTVWAVYVFTPPEMRASMFGVWASLTERAFAPSRPIMNARLHLPCCDIRIPFGTTRPNTVMSRGRIYRQS